MHLISRQMSFLLNNKKKKKRKRKSRSDERTNERKGVRPYVSINFTGLLKSRRKGMVSLAIPYDYVRHVKINNRLDSVIVI